MNLLQQINQLPVAPPEHVEPEVSAQVDSLLKELSAPGRSATVQTALKKSDATDAGKNDVVDKATAGDDISFSLMRNTINSDGRVTGSDVTDYIERAEELNDEVDTVPFGLETDDGQIVKVYVNAEQADQFEEAMKKMLGMEDDIEEAINRLTTEFDIVDVVWPRTDDDVDGDGEPDPDADLSIDDTSNLEDPEGDDFAEGDYDVVASLDPEVKDDTEAKPKKNKEEEVEDEIAAAGKADDEESEDDEPVGGSSSDSEDEDDDESEDDEEKDEDGKPKKKKKKKKAQPAEPVEDEDEAEVKESLNPKPEADSPSQARAIQLMAQKGLHIAAMSEGPDNVVYIEDSLGDEYVMRGDKRLTREKHGKKLMSLKKEELEQENKMTVGSKFLERVLNEASAEDRDGVKDGFDIPLDSQARSLAAKLKLPFAKRLVAFHYMIGIPGRYLNSDEVVEGISSATDMLRKQVGVRRAFQALYSAMATAKGLTIQQDVKEGREVKNPAQQLDADMAKRLDKLANGEDEVMYKGVNYRRTGPRNASSTKVGQWKVVVKEDSRMKRGDAVQKLLETVLVRLGLPSSFITTDGPSAVGTALARTAKLIEENSDLQAALRLLATRMGVKPSDAERPIGEGQLDEASDLGNTAYAEAVASLIEALGVPDTVFEGGRAAVVRRALVEKSRLMRNRNQVITMMGRVKNLINTSTAKPGAPAPEDTEQ